MKITIVGMGYVGLSLATLLSKKNEVIALDIDKSKVDKINKRISPLKDDYIEKFFKEENLSLTATLNKDEAFRDSKFVIVCTPTNYDENSSSFDTSSVEEVIIEAKSRNDETIIVIKSTIPLGFTNKIKEKHKIKNIFYSPEFLRESKSLYDNLYPSRIVVGDVTSEADEFASILAEASHLPFSKIKIVKMSSSDAEAVKLFSNTYLAMRISFFNELDSYSEYKNLNTENIINGVCLDPRIGDYYNNPSFGYGGYCLPKDTKQLLENFSEIPNNIIKAVVDSNKTRKDFIIKSILNKNPKSVGVHRLTMKENSDNFRDSAIIEILKTLQTHNIDIIIYEPLITKDTFKNAKVIKSIDEFIKKSDLIITNRLTTDLKLCKNKVYTRDIFNEN